MSEGYSLDGYIEVPERILAFKAAYPDGSLQGDWDLKEVGGDTFIVYVARAYRTPDDERPAVGMAWEPFPGKTPYTKDSELMNAETSAWGRAIVALGFLAQGEKVASANEVRSRQGQTNGREAAPPSEKQLDLIEKLVVKHGGDPTDVPQMVAYCSAVLTGGRTGSASKVIDRLTKGDGAGQMVLDLAKAAGEWDGGGQEEIPADRSGLEPAAASTADEDIPF